MLLCCFPGSVFIKQQQADDAGGDKDIRKIKNPCSYIIDADVHKIGHMPVKDQPVDDISKPACDD